MVADLQSQVALWLASTPQEKYILVGGFNYNLNTKNKINWDRWAGKFIPKLIQVDVNCCCILTDDLQQYQERMILCRRCEYLIDIRWVDTTSSLNLILLEKNLRPQLDTMLQWLKGNKIEVSNEHRVQDPLLALQQAGLNIIIIEINNQLDDAELQYINNTLAVAISKMTRK